MNHVDNFSHGYRTAVAKDLFDAPHSSRKTRWHAIQQTYEYQAAKIQTLAERGRLPVNTALRQRDQELSKPGDFTFPGFHTSNEPYLFKFEPFIENRTGTIVGVGSDQVLDLFANSQAESAYVVDITPSTSSITRTLLEIGAIHKKLFGQYLTPNQFISYFNPTYHKEGKSVFDSVLDPAVYDAVTPLLTQADGFYGKKAYYHEYLQRRKRLGNPQNPFPWTASQSHIARVLQAYGEGRIHVINGDLADLDLGNNLNQSIFENNSDVSVIYLSNIEGCQQNTPAYAHLVQNVASFPLQPDAILLRTFKPHDYYSEDYLPKSQNDPLLRHRDFQRWHYNVHDINDWLERARDPKYANYGWRDDLALGKSVHIEKGLTATGFSEVQIGNAFPHVDFQKPKSFLYSHLLDVLHKNSKGHQHTTPS